MINYSLTITELGCIPDNVNNVVSYVKWIYTGMENERSASIEGSTNIIYDPITEFISYDKLTHNEVTNWVMNTWSDVEETNNKNIIRTQLQIIRMSPPWA